MKKITFLTLLIGFIGSTGFAQSIGTGNPFDCSTDQFGMASGTQEGYTTCAEVVRELDALILGETDVSTAIQDVQDNLDAHIAADTDITVDTYASTDGSIENSGDPDALNLDIVALPSVNIIAADPAALQALTTALAGNPIAMQTLAAAIISPDARNTVFIATTDGLIAENDAAPY